LISEIDSMASTVTEFLTWTELEHSGVRSEPRPVRVREAVENVARRLDAKSKGRIKLEVLEDQEVLASPLHFEQLVGNLISNAVKYSPADSKVEIVIEGERVRICDRGEGVPEPVLRQLGQPFNRGHRRAAADGLSSGLGLAISKSIARHYGWDLEFERRGGQTSAIVNLKSST
jgi:signal transduction histidine kinase